MSKLTNFNEQYRAQIYETLLARGVPAQVTTPLQIVHVIANFRDPEIEKTREREENKFFTNHFPADPESVSRDPNEKIRTKDGVILQWNKHQKFSTYTFYCLRHGGDECQSVPTPKTVTDLLIHIPGEKVDVVSVSVVAAPSFISEEQQEFGHYLQGVIEHFSKKASDYEVQVAATEDGKYELRGRRSQKAKQYRKDEQILTALKVLFGQAQEEQDPIRKHRAIEEVKAEVRKIVKNLRGHLYKVDAKTELGVPQDSSAKLFGNYSMSEASIWSPFSLKDSTAPLRILIYEKSINDYQLKRIIRLVLDVWTYTILSLHLVKAVKGRLDEINETAKKLNVLMNEIHTKVTIDDAKEQLKSLLENAETLEKYYADIGGPLGAVPAYTEIVSERLKQLEIEKIPATQNIESFILERLMPESRLCENLDSRLKGLAKQNARATGLVRTKVDLDIQRQNGEVLHSLDRNSAQQLALQEMVEVISLLPLTYYAHHLLPESFHHWSQEWPGVWKYFNALPAFLFVICLVGLVHMLLKRKKSHSSVSSSDTTQQRR